LDRAILGDAGCRILTGAAGRMREVISPRESI
jgi:hypothetical protein